MECGLYTVPNGLFLQLILLAEKRDPIASEKQEPIVKILSDRPIRSAEGLGLNGVRKLVINYVSANI
jgi:hypothetical protein